MQLEIPNIIAKHTESAKRLRCCLLLIQEYEVVVYLMTETASKEEKLEEPSPREKKLTNAVKKWESVVKK